MDWVVQLEKQIAWQLVDSGQPTPILHHKIISYLQAKRDVKLAHMKVYGYTVEYIILKPITCPNTQSSKKTFLY